MYIPVSYQPKNSLGPRYKDQSISKFFLKYPIAVPAWYGKKKEKGKKGNIKTRLVHVQKSNIQGQ
jgi:hypothetical protein